MIEINSPNYISIDFPAKGADANATIAEKGSVLAIGKVQGVLNDNTNVNELATYIIEADVASGYMAGSAIEPGNPVYYNAADKRLYKAAGSTNRPKFGIALNSAKIAEKVYFQFKQVFPD